MDLNEDQFNYQIARLRREFGEKNFSEEKISLIRSALWGLTLTEVVEIINRFMSEKRVAPLPIDFKDAALKILSRRSIKSTNEKKGVCTNDPKKVLAENYPKCESFLEALEIERKRLRDEQN